MAFSSKTVELVKATAPVVGEHATEITRTFYKTMFRRNPEVLAFFNKSHQKSESQPRALAHAVVAFASNIDNLGALGPTVENIAHRHCALSVLPAHYGIVHENLMMAIGEVLGDAVTPEIGGAWSEAVSGLANILIDAEEDLYKQLESRRDGWRLEQDFVLQNKTTIGTDTMEFQLVPAAASGTPSFEFAAGQYTTVRIPGLEEAPRHYTVTSPEGADHIAYTARRVSGGAMSNYMHDELKVGDTVQLAAPCGTYMRDANDAVLMTAGIGITPAWALVQKLGASAIKGAFHVDQTPERDGFRPRFEAAGVSSKTHYTGEDHSDLPNMANVANEMVQDCGTDVSYYVVGPPAWMKDTLGSLKAAGASNVYTEVFGTGHVETTY